MSEDRHFHALRLLQANPALSQRALVEKGWIKIQNFRTSKDKRAYSYLLTPQGVEQKAQITLRFLQRKEAEYLALEAEIARLRLDVRALRASRAADLDRNA